MIRNLSLPQCSLYTSYGRDTQVRLWFTTQICLLRGGNGDRIHARSRLDPLWNSRLSTSTDKWRTTDITNCGRQICGGSSSIDPTPLHRNPASPASSATGRGVRSDQNAQVARRTRRFPPRPQRLVGLSGQEAATATTSPLRQRMIEDMTIRNLSQATQQSYINAVINRRTGSLSGTCARLLHLIAQKLSGSPACSLARGDRCVLWRRLRDCGSGSR